MFSEAGAAEEEGARSRLFEVRCTPDVRWKWHFARSAAKRAAGRYLHVSEAAELIAAEVLSALPIEERAEEGACEEVGVSWRGESELEPGPLLEPPASEFCDTGRVPLLSRSFPPPPLALPPALASLLEGLEDADAFSLDERFRQALSMEQGLEARIGPLVTVVWGRFLPRGLGYRSREAYARERLGMEPHTGSGARASRAGGPLERALRPGLQDGSVVLGEGGHSGTSRERGGTGEVRRGVVVWAERVTVRRLRDDVERAVALRETQPEAFRRAGGLPSEARRDREIGAAAIDPRTGIVPGEQATDSATGDGGIGVAERGWARGIVAGERGDHLNTDNPDRNSRAQAKAAGDREIGAPAMDPRPNTVARVGWGVGSTRSEDHLPLDHRHSEPLKSAPDEICWARFFGPADVVQLSLWGHSGRSDGHPSFSWLISYCSSFL